MDNTIVANAGRSDISPRMGIFGAVRFAMSLLTLKDRVKFRLVVTTQMCLSVLDLAGVLLLGAVGFLAALSIQSLPTPDPVLQIQRVLGLESWTLFNFTALLAAAAACLHSQIIEPSTTVSPTTVGQVGSVPSAVPSFCAI